MSREAIEREHAAAVEGAGVVPLERWTTVRVTGGDRTSFLHNMCTNDIRSLTVGGGCEAFFTDVKGRIVAHAFVLVGDGAIRLLMVPGSAERLIGHLDRYIIREDVQLVDESAEFSWLLVVGRKAGVVLDRLGVIKAADLSSFWSHARGAVGGSEIQVARCDLPWCGGYLLAVPQGAVERVRAKLFDAGAADASESAWQAIRVESAWPLWGVDFDGANLPQEVGRNAAAINFRKGCYLGQETVARIDALGHVNKSIVQVRFAGDAAPTAGAELSQGQQAAGRATSTCWSPRFGALLGLAMVRRGVNAAGTRLQCGAVDVEVLPSAPSMPS